MAERGMFQETRENPHRIKNTHQKQAVRLGNKSFPLSILYGFILFQTYRCSRYLPTTKTRHGALYDMRLAPIICCWGFGEKFNINQPYRRYFLF